MLKKIFVCVILLLTISYLYAGQGNVIDTPTTQIIEYGSFEVDFRFFRENGATPKLAFGIFSFLNLGLSWEVLELIGDRQAKPAVPAVQAKIQIFSGDMLWPGLAIGYDGQGYMHKEDANDRYHQPPKGIYIVIGREVFAEGLMMNAGVNSNTFKNGDFYGFVNMLLPIASDKLFLMAEYDNINYIPEARINLGLRVALSQDVRIDLIFRDCWGTQKEELYPNDRMLSLSYTGQF